MTVRGLQAVRPDVELVVLGDRSRPALLDAVGALGLAPGQERFVLAPATTLAEALADPERTPFAVLAPAGAGSPAVAVAPAGRRRRGRGRREDTVGGRVVGYGVLDRRGYLDHLIDHAERTVLLRGYCVAAPVQGRGYGAAGARAARALAMRAAPSADLVVLSVDEANASGLGAYARAGFVDTGARYAGRSGTEVVMAAAAGDARARPARGRPPQARAATLAAASRRVSARRS